MKRKGLPGFALHHDVEKDVTRWDSGRTCATPACSSVCRATAPCSTPVSTAVCVEAEQGRRGNVILPQYDAQIRFRDFLLECRSLVRLKPLKHCQKVFALLEKPTLLTLLGIGQEVNVTDQRLKPLVVVTFTSCPAQEPGTFSFYLPFNFLTVHPYFCLHQSPVHPNKNLNIMPQKSIIHNGVQSSSTLQATAGVSPAGVGGARGVESVHSESPRRDALLRITTHSVVVTTSRRNPYPRRALWPAAARHRGQDRGTEPRLAAPRRAVPREPCSPRNEVPRRH